MPDYLKCKDYTVSNEQFKLRFHDNYDMLVTYPMPKIEDLGGYYKSEKYISHTDSNESLVDKVYQKVKKHTIKSKVKSISKYKIGEKKLLDIGCGTGEFLLACENDGWNVLGVEPNKEAKELTASKIKTGNNLFKSIEDVFSLQNDVKFDVITMWHVLEHVPNLDETVKKLADLLTENGVLLVAVPNFKSFDALYYKEFWAAFDVPRHLWHFSRTSIDQIFAKEGLKLIETKPMWFDSFYVSMLSEEYKRGNSSLIRAFFIGLYSNFLGFFSKEVSSHIYLLEKRS